MPPPAQDPIGLPPDDPVANALARARYAVSRGDATGADVAYLEAVQQARGRPMLWSGLAIDHVEALRLLRRATLALRRCDEYLRKAGPNGLALRVQRAEIRSHLGDHTRAGAEAAEIRDSLGDRPEFLTSDDDARLHRVQGLSAAQRGDRASAERHLDAARTIFLELGDEARLAVIELDLLGLHVREGDQRAVAEALSAQPPRTPSDYRLLAMALRRGLRYEEAFEVLLRGALDRDLDPALHWPVLYDMIVVLRLIRQDGVAERLRPLLAQAAVDAADPAAVAVAIARLSADGAPSDAVSPQFDRQLQQARRLISNARLDKAESLVIELRSRARTDREVATWHLAAGELERERYRISGDRSFARDAAGQLSKAVEHSCTAGLVEVRVCALRVLGELCYDLDAYERAAQCWAEAHRIEEVIAGRQITDDVRIGMLQAAPDEYDKGIEASAARSCDGVADRSGASAVVVAMEAARGATILGRILAEDADVARDLPNPGDVDGARRWVRGITRALPRSQVLWIMHATPDRIHHAVLSRGLPFHTSVPAQRNQLTNAVNELMMCWHNEQHLEASITDGRFEKQLDELAALVGIDVVIPELPARTRRIAIVAADALSDIPFAAMRIPGGTERLGARFALSDLPCLSVRLPLRRRARRSRGDRRLLVSPPAADLTRAAGRRTDTELTGGRATLATLQAQLELHRHHQIRIDCHGRHEPDDPATSWLQLAPDDTGGRLRPEQLQWMDLSGCGTLVLGACESGMAQRKGRDERIGFVRAAMHAGAPAVIAARWRAEDTVAATVLDRFDRYVRYLPRDLALQRAQLDVCRGAPGTPTDVPAIDHPARWACWTLYGDSGWQTGADPVRRSLRRYLDQGR